MFRKFVPIRLFVTHKFVPIRLSVTSMITELNNKITPLTAFLDEAFDKTGTSGYQLIVQIGLDGVQLAVKEIRKNKFIALENYQFKDVFSFDIVTDLWDMLALESKLILPKYKQVTCIVVNNHSTIVPAPLFDAGKKTAYLQFNSSIEESDWIGVDDIKNLDAKNIFAIPLVLKEKLDSQFSGLTYHHCSTVLLESLLVQNKNQASKKFIVHIHHSRFEAIVLEGKKLVFYNTFQFLTPEDFIYYLLFIYEQLQMNPETQEAVFIGDVEKNSELFNWALRYIRTVKMGERTDTADYSYQLQTLPRHSFFTLFNSYL